MSWKAKKEELEHEIERLTDEIYALEQEMAPWPLLTNSSKQKARKQP